MKSCILEYPLMAIITNLQNFFPIATQYVDWKNGGMQSKLLDVKSPKNKTSLTIANKVKETLKKRRLFDKCISFTGDDCNTNFGGIQQRGNNIFYSFEN